MGGITFAVVNLPGAFPTIGLPRQSPTAVAEAGRRKKSGMSGGRLVIAATPISRCPVAPHAAAASGLASTADAITVNAPKADFSRLI